MIYSQEQLALQSHIEASNKKIRDENQGSFLMLSTSDIEHWATYGITTIAQYEHDCAVSTYMEVYRDINGVKPRWMSFEGVPAAKIWDEVNKMMEAENAEQKEREDEDAKHTAELAHNNRYRPNNVFAGALA